MTKHVGCAILTDLAGKGFPIIQYLKSKSFHCLKKRKEITPNDLCQYVLFLKLTVT